MVDYRRNNYQRRDRRSNNYDEPVVFKTPAEEQFGRIKAIFFKLGDANNIQSNLEQVVPVIQKEYDLDKESMIKAFKLCLFQVPFKISIYGTLTGLLNVRNFDIAADMIKAAADLLNEGLQDSAFRKVKLMVFSTNT